MIYEITLSYPKEHELRVLCKALLSTVCCLLFASSAEPKVLRRAPVSNNISAPPLLFSAIVDNSKPHYLKEQGYEEKLFWHRNSRSRNFSAGT
jgi:hypothetical protein